MLHQACYISIFSTPSGLEEWFADKANSRGKIITFYWDDSEEQALISIKEKWRKGSLQMDGIRRR